MHGFEHSKCHLLPVKGIITEQYVPWIEADAYCVTMLVNMWEIVWERAKKIDTPKIDQTVKRYRIMLVTL